MKICPTCGTTAPDSSVVCQKDGVPLIDGATATTLVPSRRGSAPFCPVCGAGETQAGGRECTRCGNRITAVPSTAPGSPGEKVAGFTVVRAHGDGDLLVRDGRGGVSLLVFGSADAIAAEALALATPGRGLPAVVRQGDSAEVGHFALLAVDLNGAVPIVQSDVSFAACIALCRSVLDVAAEFEARGWTWEPAETDLYLRGTELVVVRARGARKLPEGARLNAKRALEALANALLPAPFSLATPEVVRLVLPRYNFSTPAERTIEEARAELSRAEALAASRGGGAGGRIAELCDPGLRRHHGEDATAIGAFDVGGIPLAVLVVCDGVSSSSRAGEASTLASRVARDSLAELALPGAAPGAPSGPDVTAAVTAAIRAAHDAVCAASVDHASGAPPGTTIVAAVVHGRTLTVGWLGDSRAYWVTGDTAVLCTTDHSWLNEALARGSVGLEEAMESPFAHALTKCLGPLEGTVSTGPVAPDVRTRVLGGPGHLVLCTDGLWNYFPGASAIGDLVRAAGDGAAPDAIARFLVCRALAEGGGDNVSVAVYSVP